MIPAVCLGEGYGGVTLMSVVRSLGRLKIPVCALTDRSDSPARFSRYCTCHVVAKADRDPEALEEALIKYAHGARERPVLFVIGDAEVSFAAARRAALEPYFRMNLPELRLMKVLADKRQQYRAVEQLGISMPRTYYDLTVTRVGDGEFEPPVLIKPAVSAQWRHGRLKALVAEDRAQLEWQLGELQREGTPVVVQSLIPGPATQIYTVSAYLNTAGEPVAWATYRKERQYPIDYGLGAVASSVSEPELENAALRLLRGLGFTGVCGIEFKKDPRDGSFRFIELNSRFELQNALIGQAGVNLAATMYADLTNGSVPMLNNYRVGVTWMAANLEWKACRQLAAQGKFSWRAWFKSIQGLRTEALLTWDDPMPGIATYLRVLTSSSSWKGQTIRKTVESAGIEVPRLKDSSL